MIESIISHDSCYTKEADHEHRDQNVTQTNKNTRIQVDDTDTTISQNPEKR